MRLSAAILLLTASLAQAAPPKVVTDIPPVHSLTALVMGDLGEPRLLVAGNTNPHAAALRPSQARALQEADLVIWMGPEMTPWLERAVISLPDSADEMRLLHLEGTHELEMRDGDDDGHGNSHGDHAADPHAWLDPVNAQVWVRSIADALAKADPENAAVYRANADATSMDLGALERQIDARLAPLREEPFAVMRDAFQYFEARFDLNMAAALSPSDASRAEPARVRAFQKQAREANVACLMIEPGTSQARIAALSEDSGLDVVVMDPIGRQIAPGPDQYFSALTAIADAFVTCLGRDG